MENRNLHHNSEQLYLAKLLLLIYGLFGAGFVLAGKSIDPSPYLASETLEATNEIICLAQNIYFEARSESEQGQLAVGYVVMNRVAHKHYPNSICGVVKQGGEKRRFRCQFSWWCDGRSDLPMNKKAWERSLDLAWSIYLGFSKDPTDGALWYHADYVKPQWSSSLVLGKKIGQHLFYLSKAQAVYALNSTSTLESGTSTRVNSDESVEFPYFKVSPSYSSISTSIRFPVLQL
jgi:hypothetical protein